MKRPLPLTYFLGAIITMALLHFLAPLKHLLCWPWRLFGALPLAAGIWIDLTANATFKRHGTTVKPFEHSTALVTEGVFGATRNPFYLGMALILLGIAVLLGSATPCFVLPVYVAVMTKAFIEPEEKMLETTFGDRFTEYRKRVRRWV